MRVGSTFPNISVKAINADGDELNINLSKPQIPTVLFWYPKDFTFVCPTEIHAFQAKLKDFNDRGYQVIGASCDTAEVHFAWLNTAKEDGGIEGVEFPLLADSRRKLSKKLNILDYETEYFWNDKDDEDDEKVLQDGDNVTYRATYLIDGEGRIYHQSVNDMPLGRNIDELLRLIDAKAHVDEKGEVCPANWSEGKEAMAESRQGVKDYLSK
jgi:peroxiredoxin (alkyl hydroperoxide reductase subunit C)